MTTEHLKCENGDERGEIWGCILNIVCFEVSKTNKWQKKVAR